MNTRSPIARPLRRLRSVLAAYRSVTTIAVLLCFAAVQATAQTSAAADVSLDAQGKHVVTLNNGKTITYSEVQALSDTDQETVLNAMRRSDQSNYREWILAQAEARIRQKNEALAQMNALYAAIQESLDPKCNADDLAPNAAARRKELAAAMDKALNNPLIVPKLSPDTVQLWSSVANKLRLGQSPGRYSPQAWSRLKKQFDLGETKCTSNAH